MNTSTSNIVLVKDINNIDNGDSSLNYGSVPNNLVEFSERLFFVASDGETGHELWVSDGTEVGTRLLKNINIGDDENSSTDSNARNFLATQDKLYFVANDGETGEELWVTDGTQEGTRLVQDIRPTVESDYTYLPGSFPEDLTELDGKVYFSANDGENGRELWVSDGTSEGTKLVKDIAEGNSRGYFYPFEDRPNSSYPNSLVTLENKIYFVADNNGVNGRELWMSDATTEGTQLVKDIYPGTYTQDYFYNKFGKSRPIENPIPFDSNPYNLTVVGDKIFFSANDGVSGNELWVSDGTAAGTQLVADIFPGQDDAGYLHGSYPQNFAELDGKLYFSAKTDTSGRELWMTDGTTEGTKLVKDINQVDVPASPGSSYPQDFIEFNEKLYFSADNGVAGKELWMTDGTTEGTKLVKNIDPRVTTDNESPLPESSYPRDLTVFNGKLYFSAQGEGTGRELWVSDGTTKGTELVEDLNLGVTDFDYGDTIITKPGSSDPDYLTVVGNTLFFSANDGKSGTELFKISASNVEQGPMDVITGTTGNDNLAGNSASEKIEGLDGNDNIKGAVGDDTLMGDAGADTLNGGAGDDELFGGVGTDLLRGAAGEDQLAGEDGNDTLDGGAGNDILFGGIGDDSLLGNAGKDNIYGGAGDDTFNGGAGNDTLHGKAGDDLLSGGSGNDILLGSIGNDTLEGRAGLDTLEGGTGADVFVIRQEELEQDLAVEREGDQDLIVDFTLGVDRIGLADELTFDELSLVGDTIKVGNEVLATLEGVNTTQLSEADFIGF